MIAAMIQARMGSTRLPGKTLADIAGEPMLGHLLRRARHIPGVNEVIIATTQNPADEAIVRFADENRVPVHRGSENDVLDRFYETANRFGVSTIVRVTPDCPLLDPQIAGRVLGHFLRANGTLDYVCNTQPPTFPDGLDTEVFSFPALKRAWCEAKLVSEREHVTPYIWKNPDKFHIANVCNDDDLSTLRWTVDESQDLEFVRGVYSYLSALPSFGMAEVLALLREHPKLSDINAASKRNEGYQKSLREDVQVIGKEVR